MAKGGVGRRIYYLSYEVHVKKIQTQFENLVKVLFGHFVSFA